MIQLKKIVQLIITLGAFGLLSAQALAQESPTYSKDVAPILQEKCAYCHNPEGIGPMPLMTYDQVRPFATLIHDRTPNASCLPGMWIQALVFSSLRTMPH